MATIKKHNSTTFVRCPKDEQHLFNRVPVKLYSLNGYQLAIIVQILSNKDNWNIVKDEIQKRVGFPEKKFLEAWEELKSLGYIRLKRMWGSYHYTIYEDLDYTTGTGADCIDHTTGNSTSCTGALLTTTNNNYYIDVTTTASTACYENQFSELVEQYPSMGTKPDGTTYKLKGKLDDCKRAYIDYLKTSEMTHNEVMTALKVELNDKRMTGRTDFQQGLYRWINEKVFEQYKGRKVEPAELGYGETLI
jgi:hypothetical protein